MATAIKDIQLMSLNEMQEEFIELLHDTERYQQAVEYVMKLIRNEAQDLMALAIDKDEMHFADVQKVHAIGKNIFMRCKAFTDGEVPT